MITWIEHHMELARLIASRSKDPSEKTGAVIHDLQRRLLGSGYNGFPRGIIDTPERYANKELKKKLIVHAEANAILNSHASLRSATMVATKFPCPECAKLIVQSGIRTVISPAPHVNKSEDAEFTRLMFVEGRVFHMEFRI